MHVTFFAATHLPDILCGGASSSPRGGRQKGHYPHLHTYPVSLASPPSGHGDHEVSKPYEVLHPWPHGAASGCLHGGCSAQSSPLAQGTASNVSHLAKHQHLGDGGHGCGSPRPCPAVSPWEHATSWHESVHSKSPCDRCAKTLSGRSTPKTALDGPSSPVLQWGDAIKAP